MSAGLALALPLLAACSQTGEAERLPSVPGTRAAVDTGATGAAAVSEALAAEAPAPADPAIPAPEVPSVTAGDDAPLPLPADVAANVAATAASGPGGTQLAALSEPAAPLVQAACSAGARSVPGGPPVFANATGGTGQSLFDAAGSGDDTGRIAVEEGRRGFFSRFGNPNAPVIPTARSSTPVVSLNPQTLYGAWNITDGDPTCACTLTLSSDGDGETKAASTTGCSVASLPQVALWRVRGTEVVLLGNDRSVIGAFYPDKTAANVLTGSLTSGSPTTIWK
ncbi:MAG: AprI/Inh family metalloprotease inhibitor [Pseudomonadota bacterium]